MLRWMWCTIAGIALREGSLMLARLRIFLGIFLPAKHGEQAGGVAEQYRRGGWPKGPNLAIVF
eukprot:scaffold186272_cov24-Tisochrysis_lutea.AAC.1